jgi:hypothetical protein
VILSCDRHFADERCSEDPSRAPLGLCHLPSGVALGQRECVLPTMSSIGTGVRSGGVRAIHNNR